MLDFTKAFTGITRMKRNGVTDILFIFGLLFFILGVVAMAIKLPTWCVLFIFITGAAILLMGLGAYIYFAATNPNLLRSESYHNL